MPENLNKSSRSEQISDVQRFIDLPPEEKERIWEELDSQTHEQLRAQSRPLNREEQDRLAKFEKLRARPKQGQR